MASSANASKTRFAALALAISACCQTAHAALLDAPANCDAASGLQCRLHNILTLLYGVSIVLGALLIVIIIIAIRIYIRNRNSRKLLP